MKKKHSRRLHNKPTNSCHCWRTIGIYQICVAIDIAEFTVRLTGRSYAELHRCTAEPPDDNHSSARRFKLVVSKNAERSHRKFRFVDNVAEIFQSADCATGAVAGATWRSTARSCESAGAHRAVGSATRPVTAGKSV